jgi:hypothetical protein
MIEVRRQVNFKQLCEQLPHDCPPSLREVLCKSLHPDKASRYQSADELSRALRICLNPRCWRLLQEPRSHVGRFALRWPVLAIVLAGLIPNIITAAFNFIYNMSRIKQEFSREMFEKFLQVQWWINGLAFGIGIAAGAWMAVRTLRQLKSASAAEALEGSAQVLLFGRFISFLLLGLWIPSGLAFPVAVGWGQMSNLPAGFYVHFFLSLALCGCAATAYPYFLITAMGTHYFVPGLVRSGAISGPRRRDLVQMGRLNNIHFWAAAAVPMFGVLLLAILIFSADPQQLRNIQKWPLIAVSAGGLAGLGLVGALRRTIELDSAALSQIAVEEPRASGRTSSRSSASQRRSSAAR